MCGLVGWLVVSGLVRKWMGGVSGHGWDGE